jgi:hypothetical protein
MKKRESKLAQSNIITTVLLVLVGLAAVAIVAVFITNMVRTNVQEAEITSQVSGIELIGVQYMGEGENRAARIAIKKEAETPKNLIGLKIVLTFKDGASQIYDSTYNELDLLETTYKNLEVGTKEIQKVELIPQFGFKGKVINGKMASGWTGEIKVNPSCIKKTTPITKECKSFSNKSSCGTQTDCHWTASENGTCENHPECNKDNCQLPLGCGGNWAQTISCEGNSEEDCVGECTKNYNTECSGLDYGECASFGCEVQYGEACSSQNADSCNSYSSYCMSNYRDSCDSWDQDEQGCLSNAQVSCSWNPETGDCSGGTSEFYSCSGGIIPSSSYLGCAGLMSPPGKFTSCSGSTFLCNYNDPLTNSYLYGARCDESTCSSSFGCGSTWNPEGYSCTGQYAEITSEWVCSS